MKILTASFLLLFFSCSSCNENSKQPDTKSGTIKQEMTVDVQKLKRDFHNSYQVISTTLVDSQVKQKLQKLYNSIDNTNSYLDSVKNEMDKLDEMDVNNLEVVKTTFLYKGVGDSVLNKINASMMAAQEAAITKQQRFAIEATQDSLFDKSNDKLKEQLFGQITSVGASMIIYGFQTELYRVGQEALKRNHD